MAVINKEVFENGTAKLEIHQSWPENLYWIQVGMAGLYLKKDELYDLFALMQALVEELDAAPQKEVSFDE